MSKVIMFSRTFPSYHPRKGEQTYFVPAIWQSLFNQDNEAFNTFIKHPELKKDSDIFSSPKDIYAKNHTIRAGYRFKAGDWFSPRVWGTDINPKSGKSGAYHSRQIVITPDIQVKKVWDFEITEDALYFINGDLYAYPSSDFAIKELANNDGLEMVDLINWFQEPFKGQIICWNESINY